MENRGGAGGKEQPPGATTSFRGGETESSGRLQVCGRSSLTTDQGGGGGTREPGQAARSRVCGEAEGGRNQGEAVGPSWSEGIRGTQRQRNT